LIHFLNVCDAEATRNTDPSVKPKWVTLPNGVKFSASKDCYNVFPDGATRKFTCKGTISQSLFVNVSADACISAQTYAGLRSFMRVVLVHFDPGLAFVRCRMSTSCGGSDHEEAQAKDVFTVDMGSAIREAEDKVRRLESDLSNVVTEEKHVSPAIPAFSFQRIKARFPFFPQHYPL
jgi:hypothetical protein